MHAVYTDAPGADTPKTDPKDYVFAGVMSCINASYDDMTAEPGYIIILPPFQVSRHGTLEDLCTSFPLVGNTMGPGSGSAPLSPHLFLRLLLPLRFLAKRESPVSSTSSSDLLGGCIISISLTLRSLPFIH
jgi:hypothetical protein